MKKFIIIAFFTTKATAGLVANYEFSGQSLADSTPNNRDANIVGTLNGGVIDPDRGDVFDLTGGSGSESNPGSYLELPASNNPTGSWSLAMWIKDGPAANSYLFDNRDVVGSGGGAARLIFSTEHNTPSAGIGLFNGSWVGHPTAIRDGSWHHVVWAFDGTNLTLYTDGLASSGVFQGADLLASTVRLGNRSGDGAAGQVGRLIDDVYLYDHALNQTEVDDLIAATAPTPPPAEPPFEITEIIRNDNAETVNLTWNSNDEVSEYEVLGTADLASPLETWTSEVSNIPNGGATTSVELTDIDEKIKFFVVRPQPPIPPQSPVGDLVITPWPQSVILDEERDLIFDQGTTIYFDSRTTPRTQENTLEPLANILAGEFEILTGIKPTVSALSSGTPDSGDITLNFNPIAGDFAANEAEEDQSYSLIVSDSSGISINSQYYKGVSYGTASLLQLLEESNGNYSFPVVEIQDSPDSSYRSIMIDVARQVHSISVLEDVVRLARLFKIRYIQLHLTDDQNFTFPFPAVTDNIAGNFTYTQQELIDLVAYADARGVTLIPELDLPGHSQKIKQSGYLNPGLTDADVANPANFEKVQAIIDSMLTVFNSSPYFHIGGDESAAGAALEPFLAAMNEHLRNDPPGGKRRMLVWEGFGGAPVDELPATGDDRVIVLSWESTYNPPWNLLNSGYEVINSSWKPTYALSAFGAFFRDDVTVGKKWSPEVIYSWNKDRFMHWQPGLPVFEDTGPNDPDLSDHEWRATYIGREEQVIGGQMQVWEQPETSVMKIVIPRLPIISERLWNQELGDTAETFADFDSRLQVALERVMPIVQPIEILPGIPAVPNNTDVSVYDSFIPYEGNALSVTLRNRTKILGTIRYNLGGTSSTLFSRLVWRSIDDPASGGTDYTIPFTEPGLFGVRAGLFLADGSQLGGSTWNYYVNWENRVRVVEYDVNEQVDLPVPDMSALPASSIIREFESPTLRGNLDGVRLLGRQLTADLTAPQTGEFTFEVKNNNGHSNLFVDLNQNGVFEPNERLLVDTGNGDFWTAAAPVSLVAGEKYLIRIDHLQRLVGPRMAVSLAGPGRPSRNDITELLSLPE
ncbi:family 20 glycosylhydrolase [Roseibacillus persicicus]|uniref:family 20 glycosylhydrolase n=1 Tax=Roseibacillus persicicus TaxID=454148 RepID=UPI00398B751E